MLPPCLVSPRPCSLVWAPRTRWEYLRPMSLPKYSLSGALGNARDNEEWITPGFLGVMLPLLRRPRKAEPWLLPKGAAFCYSKASSGDQREGECRGVEKRGMTCAGREELLEWRSGHAPESTQTRILLTLRRHYSSESRAVLRQPIASWCCLLVVVSRSCSFIAAWVIEISDSSRTNDLTDLELTSSTALCCPLALSPFQANPFFLEPLVIALLHPPTPHMK